MEIVNQQALSSCIRDALRAELQQHFKADSSSSQELEERLLSKKELADELGVSLATLSDWMKRGSLFYACTGVCISGKAKYSRSCNRKLPMKFKEETIMNVELITREDLKALKTEMLNEIRQLIKPEDMQSKQWLKSAEVRKLLGISPGTLQNLRINGTLRFTKIGGMMYYKMADINRLLEGGKP